MTPSFLLNFNDLYSLGHSLNFVTPIPSLPDLSSSSILLSDPHHLPCNSCALTSVLPSHGNIKSSPLILLLFPTLTKCYISLGPQRAQQQDGIIVCTRGLGREMPVKIRGRIWSNQGEPLKHDAGLTPMKGGKRLEEEEPLTAASF